jgi:hypothetical protein
MKKLKDNYIVDICITTVLLGLLVYSAYSLWYVFGGAFSGTDVHLYTALSSVALGWFLMLFEKAIMKKMNRVMCLIAFLTGAGIFQGVIWGINATENPVINDTCYNNEGVVISAYTVAFIFSAVLLVAAFIVKAIKRPRIVNIIFALVYFVVSCGGAVVLNEENIKALDYKKNIQFPKISAEEMNVSKEDNVLCSQWLRENFYEKNNKYPFSFKVDGKELTIIRQSDILAIVE